MPAVSGVFMRRGKWLWILPLFLCVFLFPFFHTKESTVENHEKKAERKLTVVKESGEVQLKKFQEECEDVALVLFFPIEDRVFPVVYTPYDYDAYFRKDLKGNYSRMGTPFVDDRSSPDSRNLIINAHSSRDGESGMSFLRFYADSDYFTAHNTIECITEKGKTEYEIISLNEFDYAQAEPFPYNFYQGEFPSEREVEEMLESLKPYEICGSEEVNSEGKRILTLITCNMEKENSRYILLALERKSS